MEGKIGGDGDYVLLREAFVYKKSCTFLDAKHISKPYFILFESIVNN